jgi:hypothetical protein
LGKEKLKAEPSLRKDLIIIEFSIKFIEGYISKSLNVKTKLEIYFR